MSCKYLLDTNVISEINKKYPNQFVTEKMSIHQQEVSTASLVIHELLYGCYRLPKESRKKTFLLEYINKISLKMPVFRDDLKSAQYHAEQRARLSKIGLTPGFVDGQIASIASTNNLILVSNNVDDFKYFDNLTIDNWFI